MPNKVYNNVEDYRVLDGKNVVEDVTKVGLPDIKHPTTTIDAAGMIMKVDMPDIMKLEAMEYSIAHNNGANCKLLAAPGQHKHEFRIARQVYNVDKANISYTSVKVRVTGIHTATEKGDIETGNPYGSTDKYSCVRYEELIGDKVVVLIDAMAGKMKFNGTDYTKSLEKLLK